MRNGTSCSLQKRSVSHLFKIHLLNKIQGISDNYICISSLLEIFIPVKFKITDVLKNVLMIPNKDEMPLAIFPTQ